MGAGRRRQNEEDCGGEQTEIVRSCMEVFLRASFMEVVSGGDRALVVCVGGEAFAWAWPIHVHGEIVHVRTGVPAERYVPTNHLTTSSHLI
jgi:hypothetical protein